MLGYNLGRIQSHTLSKNPSLDPPNKAVRTDTHMLVYLSIKGSWVTQAVIYDEKNLALVRRR